MSQKFPLSQFNFNENMENQQMSKPQVTSQVFGKERPGSKTAPVEQELNFGEGEDINETDSYNYYIYYQSMKSKNPNLPKPTFNPVDMDFIKDSKQKEQDQNKDYKQFQNDNLIMNNQNNIYKKNNMDDLSLMINNLSLNQGNMMRAPNPTQFENEGNFSPFGGDYGLGGGMNTGGLKNQQQNQKQLGFDYYNQDPSNFMQMQSPNLMGQGLGWDENDFGGMNLGMGTQKMGQEKKGKGAHKKKGKNQQMQNQNSMFGQGMGGLDPMSLQNPSLYNSYYGSSTNDTTMSFQNPGQNRMMFPGQGNKGMGNNFGYLNDTGMPSFGLLQNMGLGMGMQGLNMGMPNVNFGNFNNMNVMKGAMQRSKKNNDLPYQKKEPIEPPTLEELINKAVELSKDHSGSRLVQKKYEEATEEERDRIFEKIRPEILSLSKDVFGNYAIQKILECKDSRKNKIILDALKTKIYDLSLHMYGCRVIQQLLNVIEDEYIPEITSELSANLEKCIEDQNGNHVIQKIIERMQPGEDNGIFEVVLTNIYKFSIHQYGCRVIQKLFNQCNQAQKQQILESIYNYVIGLCQDQYGNYVIQYVLEKEKGENVQPIYDALKGRIFEMSIHKFGSNVIEKALSYGSQKQRLEIVNEIISKDDMIHDSLLSMVKDKFGNYVVQKMIEYSDQETKENIIKRIISSQSLKKRDGFSKHVINFIEKLGFSAGQIRPQQGPTAPTPAPTPMPMMGGGFNMMMPQTDLDNKKI